MKEVCSSKFFNLLAAAGGMGVQNCDGLALPIPHQSIVTLVSPMMYIFKLHLGLVNRYVCAYVNKI